MEILHELLAVDTEDGLVVQCSVTADDITVTLKDGGVFLVGVAELLPVKRK